MKKSLLPILAFLLLAFCTSNLYAQLNEGEIITVNGSKYQIAGENLVTNSGFEDGFTGWTDATSSVATLNTPNFNIVTSGGINNSNYLVGTRNENSSSAGSIGTGWSIEAGKTYYFSYHVKYLDANLPAGQSEWQKVSLTNDKTSPAEPLVLINSTSVNGGGEWTRNEIVFTNDNPSYSFIVARFRWLSNQFGFDDFGLYEVVEVVNVDDLQAVIDEAQTVYIDDTPGANDLLSAIETAQDFLNSDSPSEVLEAIASLQEAIKTYLFLNASTENPLDVTHYMVNPGFDNNAPEGWSGIGTINHRVVEFYQRTFNIHQKITGLPSGKYVLRAQGFERPASNDGGAAYQAGTETISADLYAKADGFPEMTSSFNSLYSHSYTAAGSVNGYLNTMGAAATFLSNSHEHYEMVVEEILLEEGDTLIVGAKSDFQQTGYWVLFDNFRLEYHGAYDVDDLVFSLNKQLDLAQSLLSEKIQNSAIDQLNDVITQVDGALSADPLFFEALKSAAELINNAIEDADISKKTYEKLQNVIEDAYEVFETLGETRAQSLTSALSVAEVIVDDLDVTLEQLNQSISEISELIYKRIYVPTWMLGNVYDDTNNWSITRSRESRNWIIFWEPGYGEDPSVLADGNYRIDIDGLLEVAEKSFDYYADTLKFITRGESKTDDYKMIIRLRYTRDWEATGSGVDDMIGLLTLTAWSAQVGGHTLAHEVAHCFQYQVHCDNDDQNGWMYGFGPNASGGNGWWEMCAQWQAYKIYPELQFTDGRLANYYGTAHKNIMHEAPRYDNFFIQDYWTYLHGIDIIGRMWNESVRPEDPVEAYKRITGINQAQFNDEMFERAARFATWDIPDLISYGEERANARPQPRLNNAGDNYWMIDPSVCLENYGYNVIKLNAPSEATTVSVYFEGMAGMDGFRSKNIVAAGWRYGFVAFLNDGTRIYSDMSTATYASPIGTLSFDCPDDCKQLWLVVTGAPSFHWRHAWDDDDSNDEQWPYKVKFNNSNLLGRQNVVASSAFSLQEKTPLVYNNNNSLYINDLTPGVMVRIYSINGSFIQEDQPGGTSYSTVLNSGIYIVTVSSQKGNYNHKIVIE